MALLPICPRCELRGLHGTPDECLAALQKAVATARDHYLALHAYARAPGARNLPDVLDPPRTP